jgi:hypothetical protein
MSRPALLALASGALLAGTAACGIVSSWHPHVRTSTSEPLLRPGAPIPQAGAPGTTPSPGTPDVGPQPGADRTPRNADDRRICRSSTPPLGWIAVAYVSAPGQCPARVGADRTSRDATMAILTRYARFPIGAVLDVCADQPTPLNWTTVTDEPADGADSCPGAVRGGGSTTKRIRRIH